MVQSSRGVGVIYNIPMPSGCFYVVQTGRCTNGWMREHASSLRDAPSGHFAIHCIRSGSEPVWNVLANVC